MKRIISLILILATLLTISACGENNRDYDEAEVIAAAEKLIYKAARLNDILWGEGLYYVEDTAYDNGDYSPADYNAEYTRLDDLISDCARVYSTDYMNIIESTVFSSYFGDTGVNSYARYYQESSTEPIMVKRDYNNILTAKNEYYYSTLEALRSEGDIVIVKIKVKITYEEKDELGKVINTLTQEREREIELVEEADGWRIDSPCYSNYISNL